MKILFTRHGETEWNRQMRIQGTTNIPLNDTGRQNSKIAGEKLNVFDIVAVYTSQLDRAIETAKIMIDASKHTIPSSTIDERIVEKDFGKFEGFTFEEYAKVVDKSSCEDEQVVYERVKSFFMDIYKKHPNDTIFVVSHGACIRLFLQHEKLIPARHSIKDEPELQKYKKILNNSIQEIDFDGQTFKLIQFDL